jgi:hypothetical protein
MLIVLVSSNINERTFQMGYLGVESGAGLERRAHAYAFDLFELNGFDLRPTIA